MPGSRWGGVPPSSRGIEMKPKRSGMVAALLLVSLSACTAVQVKPLDPGMGMQHLCIQENPRVTVPGFAAILQDGIQRNGLTSQLYSGAKPAGCEYVLTYTALRSWDIGTYLSHAELRIDRDGRQVAFAQYRLRGKGGLALNKWKSAEAKMAPVIDELLAGAGHSSATTARREPDPSAAASAAPSHLSEPAVPTATAMNAADDGPVLAYSGDPTEVARTLAGMRNCTTAFQSFSSEAGRRVYSATCWGSKKLLIVCAEGACRELR